jgi:hypothetical protein
MRRAGTLLADMHRVARIILLAERIRNRGRRVVDRGRRKCGCRRERGLAYDSVIARRHSRVILIASFLLNLRVGDIGRAIFQSIRAVARNLLALGVESRVAVENLKQRLVRVVVEVVDLVAAGEQGGDEMMLGM